MQAHWNRNGPPVYILKAAELGYKPQDEKAEDLIQDPDQLMAALSNYSGGIRA